MSVIGHARNRLLPVNRWLEPLFAAAVAAGIAWSAFHLLNFGYLPQPFFYEPQDTWMDWFNTAYWAHQPGAYDSWGTIYPPLSFVVLRFLSDPRCYEGAEGLTSRDCDWFGAISFHLIFLINIFLIAKTYRKIDKSTALPRSFALACGMPMLFALERGNLLLLTFTCILLAFGPLLRSAKLRWLAAGLAINFKVYLIGALFAQLLRRRWRWFEGAMLATILVYLVSFAIFGAGTPRQLFRNITAYSQQYEAGTLLDMWYSATYKPLLSLLSGERFPIASYISSTQIEFWANALPVALLLVQGAILLAAIAAWLRPEVVPMHRLLMLSISLAVITSEGGGYTQIFLILFVFMERWQGFGRKLAIILAYILSIPFDIALFPVPPYATSGFLGLREVVAEFDVGIMPFLRPGMILLLALTLSLVTIRDVLRAAGERGWASKWRFRDEWRRTRANLAENN